MIKACIVLTLISSTLAFAEVKSFKKRAPQQEVIGQVGKKVKGTFGDLLCYKEIETSDATGQKSKYAITIAFSQLVLASTIKLENIDSNGNKSLYRGREPRLVEMNDAKNKWSTDEEYYVSNDDYVDLTISRSEKTKTLAALYEMPGKGHYEFECKKSK